jgi:hypothetical protein
VSPQRILIRNVEPEGDNSQELSVAYYDRRGEWIEPQWPSGVFHHASFVPPPPPAAEDDISIYTVMAPGEFAENCKDHDIETGLDVLQVVTYYGPTVIADLVPARASAQFAADQPIRPFRFAALSRNRQPPADRLRPTRAAVK